MATAIIVLENKANFSLFSPMPSENLFLNNRESEKMD